MPWLDRDGKPLEPGDCFYNGSSYFFQLLSLEHVTYQDLDYNYYVDGTVQCPGGEYVGEYSFACSPETKRLLYGQRVDCPTCSNLLVCTLNGVTKALNHSERTAP